ncbi:MAG: RluA family pseudouridine synthase [Opitutales bacterium]|nr:RluA family pseudouridine synthase [Opitutales bacterium]
MDQVVDLTVSPEYDSMRVDKFLATTLKEQCSRVRIQKAILDGGLTLNGIIVTQPRTCVHAGDCCRLKIAPTEEVRLKPNDSALDILYEDDDLLVVNKPAGQVVHYGNGVEQGTTLVEAVLAHCLLSTAAGALRPGVVHRLDQATSGVMLFAKTDVAYRELVRMFAERRIHKTYYAFVHGIPKLHSGIIDAPIGRSTHDRTSMCVTTRGRPAVTHWECLEAFSNANQALLVCRPITGRTHQIRVHLKHIGHPIVGDEKYGKKENPPNERLFLHAYRIEFNHPITKEKCLFTAPLPEEFAEKREGM